MPTWEEEIDPGCRRARARIEAEAERREAAKREPMPTNGKVIVLHEVIKDLMSRSDIGASKYGTLLKTENGRDALMDAYQEALDLCMYLKQALIERSGNG